MIEALLDQLVPHAHKWWARLAISLLASAICAISIYSAGFANLPLVSWPSFFIVNAVFLLSFLVIYFVFRLPYCPRDTIGFLLVIKTETKAEQARLENDFYESIKTALNESQTSLKFKVFLLPARISKSIENLEQAKNLKAQCKMRFVLYGDIRTRNHKGKEFYVLRIVSMVSHALTNEANKKLLQQEMNHLLPMESMIDCKQDLEGFELTSQQFATGAKYTISVALFISGQTEEAIELLRSIYSSLKIVKKQTEIPGTEKLINLIPDRLTNFMLHAVRVQFWKWRTENSNQYLTAVEDLIVAVPKECEMLPEVLTFRATCAFLLRRDVEESQRLIRLTSIQLPKAPHNKYSLAFLAAYSGNLDVAYKNYRAAFSLDDSDELSIEIEEFIARILEEEPDKYQLHFCLGLINLKKKQDFLQAERDFRCFIEKADKAVYEKQIEVTHKYLGRLNNLQDAA